MNHETLTERIRAALAGRDVREVRMFGGLSFMVEGHMLVAIRAGDALLVRIDPARHDEALALGARQAFMGTGRTMGPSWVTVEHDHLASDEALDRWLTLALDHHATHDKGDGRSPRR